MLNIVLSVLYVTLCPPKSSLSTMNITSDNSTMCNFVAVLCYISNSQTVVSLGEDGCSCYQVVFFRPVVTVSLCVNVTQIK